MLQPRCKTGQKKRTDKSRSDSVEARPQEPRNTIYSLQIICPTDPTYFSFYPEKIPSKGHPMTRTLAEFKEKYPVDFTICK